MTEPWLKLKGYIGVAGVRTRGLSRRDVVLIASKLFGVEGSPAEVAVAIDAMGRNRRAALDLSPPVVEGGAHHGYVFQNPDTGTEYSANHPVESGEVEDAYDIRLATYFEDHLVAELRNAKTTIGTLTESLNATSQNYSSAYTRAEAAEAKLRTVFARVPESQAVAWTNAEALDLMSYRGADTPYEAPMWSEPTPDHDIALFPAAPLSGGDGKVTEEAAQWLDQACALIQEAKGVDGPNGGFVTDHLDAAENWLDRVRAALSTMGGKRP